MSAARDLAIARAVRDYVLSIQSHPLFLIDVSSNELRAIIAAADTQKAGTEALRAMIAHVNASLGREWRKCELHPDVDGARMWGCPDCLYELRREHADWREEQQRAAVIIRGLKRGECWCEVAIGNPMVQTHGVSCLAARAYLEGKQ